MVERFYSIEHLSTEQLRELYTTYRSRGWVDFDYYRLMIEGVVPRELPDEEILFNMEAGIGRNYFVYMEDYEDEEDGIMIGFALTDYPSFSAYLHLEKSFLGEIVTKYGLTVSNNPQQHLPLFGGGKECLN